MKVDINASFIHFVYPFLFDSESFEERAKAIETARWQEKNEGLKIWREHRYPEDDLLAHVKNYLNPPEGTPPTALLWWMDATMMQSRELGKKVEWGLITPKRQILFEWIGVQLSLFAVGVGMLTVAVKPKSNELTEWLYFLHYFRFVRGQREVSVKAKRRTDKDKKIEPFFLDPAGGLENHPDWEGNLAEILDTILNTAEVESRQGRVRERENWWREVFVTGQLIPFAVIYADGESVTDGQITELLYRVRNFFPAERVIQPAADDLRLDHPSLLAYADRMWFVFSLEGGAFVAINAPKTPFFRQTLPDHLRDQYFLLFLLSLHQRFTLMSLSQEVSEHWLRGDEAERARAFERIRTALLEFTARGYFTQVMQRGHHHRVYRKWQEVFQLEQIYREVSDEVREMYEYALSEQTKRLERRLNLIGALIGVPALVMGFLSINLYGITAREEGLPLWVALLLAALSFSLGGLAWWWLSRR